MIMPREKKRFTIGVDVSKLTLDVSLFSGPGFIEHTKISNTETEIAKTLIRLKKEYKCTNRNAIICTERTGIYNNFLRNVSLKKKYRYWEEHSPNIKLFLGIKKEKNDRADSIKIAKYAEKFPERFKQYEPERDCIMQLKTFWNFRKKLIDIKKMLQINRTEFNHFGRYVPPSSIEISNVIEQELIQVMEKMQDILKRDEQLHRIYSILISIPHVGNILAIHMIIVTNEFTKFENPKQFSSYIGTAPFSNRSGTSKNRRSKISFNSPCETKSLIHICLLPLAKDSVKTQLSIYYKQKITLGKHPLLALNASKNKLIRVIFHCVKNDVNYCSPLGL